jgi:hypothetical protein
MRRCTAASLWTSALVGIDMDVGLWKYYTTISEKEKAGRTRLFLCIQ